MTTTTPSSVLARHIHKPPADPHRLVLLDDRRLRCLDCEHTLVLPTGVGSTSTSSRALPNIDDPNACPQHPGNWAEHCAPCRSEALAVPEGQTKHRPTPAWVVDPTPEFLAARAAFDAKQAQRARELDGDQEPTLDRDEIRRRIDAEQAREVPAP